MNKKWTIAIFLIIAVGLSLLYSEYFIALFLNEDHDEMSQEPPLILVHGFNPVYNPRIGELSFKEMQFRLSDGLGYEDRGIYITNMSCASIRGEKIVIRFSYFDNLQNPTIEEYTRDFGDAVERIKNCTGAEKVDIVSHSMGGVVARNYIRTIDNSSIRKLIMLGTPNHGGLYNIAEFADRLAEEWDYNFSIDFIELSENNEFMKELNEVETVEGIEYYTAAGDIDGRGDGVVLKDSVWLDEQEGNITVDCFHTFIKSPFRCEKAYGFVKQALQR
ncbi:alpha/beta fold hydrolase [Candidatus Woesearchaeota archaeon]|nr:alpha/beta fold hydrolase [Candidatus Woesearchaeota archaeon]